MGEVGRINSGSLRNIREEIGKSGKNNGIKKQIDIHKQIKNSFSGKRYD